TLGFRFMEFSLDGAVANSKFAHNLGYIPKDVIMLQLTGEGTLTFNYNLFDSKNIDVSSTGAVKVRLFIGTYRKSSNLDTKLTDADVQAFSSGASSSGSTASGGTPTGVILDFAGPPSRIPDGYLLCDGAAYSVAA